MNPVGLTAASSVSSEVSGHQKVRRAAQEFEAVLLNTLLGSLESSFATVPGDKMESGSSHYQYLGIQTLSSSLAARGGLGIADLITRSLMRTQEHAQQKSPTRGASLGRPF